MPKLSSLRISLSSRASVATRRYTRTPRFAASMRARSVGGGVGEEEARHEHDIPGSFDGLRNGAAQGAALLRLEDPADLRHTRRAGRRRGRPHVLDSVVGPILDPGRTRDGAIHHATP